jgi:hypothetical protein
MKIKGIKLHESLTEERIGDAVIERGKWHNNPGFCIRCGHEHEDIDCFASEYKCESCVGPFVYGLDVLYFKIESSKLYPRPSDFIPFVRFVVASLYLLSARWNDQRKGLRSYGSYADSVRFSWHIMQRERIRRGVDDEWNQAFSKVFGTRA